MGFPCSAVALRMEKMRSCLILLDAFSMERSLASLFSSPMAVFLSTVRSIAGSAPWGGGEGRPRAARWAGGGGRDGVGSLLGEGMVEGLGNSYQRPARPGECGGEGRFLGSGPFLVPGAAPVKPLTPRGRRIPPTGGPPPAPPRRG